jgi:two-component system OmpR family response regulator
MNPTVTSTLRELETVTRPSRNHLDGRGIQVLVVDAECVVAEMLSMALKYEGAQPRTAYDACTALATARQFRPDLVIYAGRLPDMDGAALLARLLETQPELMTILLRHDGDRESSPGAMAAPDGCLTKPFSIEDALARVRGVLRDNGVDNDWVRSRMTVGDLVLDDECQSVSRAGVDISLTPTEFRLLRFLVRNARRAVSTGEILGRVWAYDNLAQPAQVRLYVLYLRRRIDAGRDPMIHTVRRTGYLLKPTQV